MLRSHPPPDSARRPLLEDNQLLRDDALLEMTHFSVKHTDCHSFFGWSSEDENARRAEAIHVGPGEPSFARLRPFGEPGLAAELLEDSTLPVQPELQLMLVGLKTPDNLGSILRIAACFDVAKVHHVGQSNWLAAASVTDAPDVGRGTGTVSLSAPEYTAMSRVAVGCEMIVARRQWSMRELSAFLDAHRPAQGETGDGSSDGSGSSSSVGRLPFVALETATGALPLPSFQFPRRCVLLAGAEGAGIDIKLLRRLQPGLDAIVYVPMPGPHKSMNVAEAVSCAVYEYRRQWPGHGTGHAAKGTAGVPVAHVA
jgi:tRNA(Leu) C34 or U34 (ribose-2'-O)-methylase TrmL